MDSHRVPTIEHVREIIDTQLEDKQILSLISSSIVFMNSVLGKYNLEPQLFSEIVRWVSAHRVSMRDPSTRAIEEKIGESSIKYPNIMDSAPSEKPWNNLMTSWWGQEAASMDPTGSLSRLGGPPPKIVSFSFNKCMR